MGTLDRIDPNRGETVPVHATLDLILVKPMRQRLVARGTAATMTTVLDGYEAWDLLRDNADPAKFRLRWLPAADVKTLRANTWENLSYYRVPEGGSIEDKGPATVDGVVCERVDFVHGPGSAYERYFDRDTGRLMLTVRGPETFRESGEIRVEGVRFPRTIVSRTKTSSGKEIVSTATFESVVLNEAIPPGLFAAPDLPTARTSAAGATGK